MEAHILGSLVPSIEHLILIGDPLQLRPTLNNYCEPIYNVSGGVYKELIADVALSMESKRGEIYKFDMSLMERLSVSGLPMSRIDVQRRMRPEISSLIRFANFGNILLSPPSYYLFTINTETLFIQVLKITNSLRSTQTFEGSKRMCSLYLIIIVKMKVAMTQPANSTCMRYVVMTFYNLY